MSANERDLIVGGQAVIEGVMMRTPNAYAVAVRRSDGAITHTGAALPKWSDKYPVFKLPILRGAAVLVQSMSLGIKALNYSASEAFDDAEKAEATELALTPAVVEGEGGFAAVTGGAPGLFPTPARKSSKDEMKRGANATVFGSIVFALLFNITLFIVAPLLLTNALYVALGWDERQAASASSAAQQGAATKSVSLPSSSVETTTTTGANDATQQGAWYARFYAEARAYLKPVEITPLFNLIDGLIRIVFFLLMIVSFSLMRDIRRVFEYHGAEHKTVYAWEAGLPLTVENARRQPRQHPRCGTSFLMVVMIVSIALFSFVKFDELLHNLLVRVALLPVVAGLSYEVIRLSAKKESSLVFKLITLPGVWLQNITTKEPDDEQLEVAIFALKESLKLEPQAQAAAPVPLA